MPAFIGQCRGDLGLLHRQLAAVGIRVTYERARTVVTARSPPPLVILGDLICPLNAWCSYAPCANDDARILQTAVAVANAVGAALVLGLHEQLLMRGVTARCAQGTNHRKLLALVASKPFRRALAEARANEAHGVVCAARAPVAILNDNASRPPPVGLAACWHRLSVYDRGTRFQIKRGASYVDVPHVGLGSRAFAVHPLALRDHLMAEYGRLRCGAQQWAAALEPIKEQYEQFERARRERIAVTPSGASVRDTERAALASAAELQEPVTRMFEDIVARYHVATSAAELYAATLKALEIS
jgi:hypothetical protein